MVRQLTFEDVSATTTNLLCEDCLQHTMTMTSEWNERKGAYYYHKVECSNCGLIQYPCGIKPYLLDHWEDIVHGRRSYMKMKGWL